MVNYRRVLSLLSVLVAVVNAAPTPDCTQNHYDQRQNGSENYRLNIDGVVVAVAPAESLLSAFGDIDDLMDLLAIEDYNGDYKPKPPTESSSSSWTSTENEKPKPQEKPVENKPAEEKPAEEKPLKEKPQEIKPEEPKPEVPAKPAELPPLSDVSLNEDMKVQKKEVSTKKQEKAKRLKNRLAAFLMPLLRKTRHQ
ncbi:unnamed protein product [Arctia plantaginis]|uniref:Uncharacterized protein n=1 Tax=Arctia plantaginis TaxID=874455 RepID=A0A8S0ZP18_ARCPL|nr:unnamed protein product [Arctia plantaginis]